MKSRIAIALFFAAACLAVPAQEITSVAAELGTSGQHFKGGQTISISAGLQVPLFVLPESAGAIESRPLGLGGSFGLTYQYFVADHIALGGSFSGAFNGTVGGRSLFIAPLSFRTAYWWGKMPMEYFASLDLGGSIMRLSGNGMITPFAKAGGGAFYLINGSWSVGAQAFWWFIPEIHSGSYSALTRYGNIAEISAAAVYHL
ncbi:MAG: hypothetical protein ABFC75_01410 [Rectinema sp.]